MVKNVYKIAILTFLLLFFIPMVSADKVTVESQNGYVILTPEDKNIQVNEDYTFRFNVYDLADGTYIDNSTTSCFIEIFGPKGEYIFDGELPYAQNTILGEWRINVTSGNWTETGTHHYFVECDDDAGNLGGARSEILYVTPTGEKDLELGQGIIIFASLAVVLFIAWLFANMAKDMETTASKVVAMGVSGIMVMIAVLFTTAAMQIFVWNSASFIESYASLWLITKVVISMGVLAAVLYAGYKAFTLWQYKRGLID